MRIAYLFVAILLALAETISLAGPASAQDTKSANYWLMKCRGPQHTLEFGECLAFIQGWDSGMKFEQDLANVGKMTMAPLPYCVPTGVTYGQVANIINNYAWRNPAQTHIEFGLFIALALRDAFPCQQR
jgi:hypothetical protein